MINSITLNSAAGVSHRDNDGGAESNMPSIIQQSVIIGRFKRGRTDQPFKVTATNFKALLGEDQKSADFLTVQDAFRAGANEVWIYRLGKPKVRLADDTEIGDNKEYEHIAFESNLYPIPVYRNQAYKPVVALLDASLRSQQVRPTAFNDGYLLDIQHLNIIKESDGKWFAFDDGYSASSTVLDAHHGSKLKQPVAITDTYKPTMQALSLSIRYGIKKIKKQDAYTPAMQQLDAVWVSKFKYKTIDAWYTPSAEPLSAMLSQRLEQSDVMVGTQGYKHDIGLLDLTISNQLQTMTAGKSGYQALVEPMTMTMKQVLQVVSGDIDDGSYAAQAEPLSAAIENKGSYFEVAEGYQTGVELLTITYKLHLAGGTDHKLTEGYTVALSALDISQSTYHEVSLALSIGGYQPSVTQLDISTTQRIR